MKTNNPLSFIDKHLAHTQEKADSYAREVAYDVVAKILYKYPNTKDEELISRYLEAYYKAISIYYTTVL